MADSVGLSFLFQSFPFSYYYINRQNPQNRSNIKIRKTTQRNKNHQIFTFCFFIKQNKKQEMP